jgi:hypothetical protein
MGAAHRPRRRVFDRAFFASALVILSCAACESEAHVDSGMTEFLAGVPVLAPAEEASLGSESAHLGPILARVGSVVLGPDLAVYVADPVARTVTRFDSDLRSYHTFGGQGQGPGEAASVTNLSIWGDSILVLSDRVLGRVSLFTLNGDFVEAISGWSSDVIRMGTFTHGSDPPIILLPDGSGLSRPMGSFVASAPQPMERMLENIVVRHHPERKPDQIISRAEYLIRRAPDFMRGGVRLTVHEPFPKTAIHTLMKDGSGVVAAYPISPDVHEERGMEVRRLSIDGEIVFTMRFPAEWTPLTDWMIRDRMEEMAERLRASAERALVEPPTAAEVERHVRRAGLMAPHPNPILAFGVIGAESGSVWIALEAGQPGTNPWVRVDREGTTTGQIILPSSERVVAERDHRLLTVRTDAVGVQELVVYRLDSPGAAQPE